MRGSVQKKNGRYYLVYYLPNGKQKWEKSGTNKKEAERLLVSRVNQINRGEYVELKEIDFAGFAERWFREYADGAVKLSTLAAYRSVVKNHLTPQFADVRLTGVSLEYVQGYVTEKREAGYAPKTIRNHIVILK